MVPEDPCQCTDCQKFYREHDRLIRESPTLRQQQELNWAALQSFRTLAGRALEELQKQYGTRLNNSPTKEIINNYFLNIQKPLAMMLFPFPVLFPHLIFLSLAYLFLK